MAPEVENFLMSSTFKRKCSDIIRSFYAGFEYFKRAFQSGVNRITHFSNALTLYIIEI